jgi:hypothetical protein
VQNVNNGDTLFLKYDLVIKTNVHQIIQNIPYDVGSEGFALPNNRTNVRYFPFYKLLSDGSSEQTLNNGLGTGDAVAGQRLAEHIPPLFEDFGLLNTKYIGSGNGSLTTTTANQPGPRKWRLQIYNTALLPSYNNINSTSLTNFNNTAAAGTTTFFSEANSILKRIDIQNNIYASNPPNNTWQRTLRFSFTPTQWVPSADRMMLYPLTDGEAGTTPRWYINNNIDCGVLTTLESPYNAYTNASDPSNPDIYVGFDYTFNFQRL